MATSLSETLETDSFYLVEFYLSKSEKSIPACDCIDVWMLDSNNLVLPTPLVDNSFIEGNPQLHSPENVFLSDTINWMRLAWTYKATGNENMIIIGNFSTDEETSYISFPETHLASYYYIDDVTVKKIPQHLAQLNIGTDTTVCDSSSFVKTLTAQPIYENYLWNTGETGPSITVTTPGTYWVDAGFEDCIISDTIHIYSRAVETESFAEYLELCPEDLPYHIIAPDSMDTYFWSDGSESAFLPVSESGVYWVEATYACGIWRDTIEILILQPDPIELGADTVLCNQPVFSETLMAPGGYDSYMWNTGATTPSLTIETPGQYWVIATNDCGQFSDTIEIINQPFLELSLGQDTTFCLDENLLLASNLSFDTYQWNTGANTPEILVEDYGTYILEAIYACGTEQDSITIFPPPDLWISLPSDMVIGLGDSIIIQPEVSLGDNTYQWQPAELTNCDTCLSISISPIYNNTFTIVVIDQNGCTASAEIMVGVEKHRGVYIPNAFSPNADLTNDIFTIYGGNEVAKIESLQIFTRWGAMIYQQTDFPPNNTSYGWDGYYKGEKLGQGVYAVKVEVLYIDGVTEVFVQDLTLME